RPDRSRRRLCRRAASQRWDLRRSHRRLGVLQRARPGVGTARNQPRIDPAWRVTFYEHVRSPHRAFRGLQYLIDSLYWTRALGGCRTTRDTERTIRAAGFRIVSLE